MSKHWKALNVSAPGHYTISAVEKSSNGMDALREMFPNGMADDLNFVLFSTSGVHGSYCTIEDVEENYNCGRPEEGVDEVTFLVVQPRIVALRYGNAKPECVDDIDFLKRLRASSLEVVSTIGIPATGATP